MGFDIVFTKEAFAKKLIEIATQMDTDYDNKFPYNCGYYGPMGKFSWDCWNLVKSIIWGWQPNKTVGYYCYQPGLYGLGDWDGGTMMAYCEDVSEDFRSVTQGEFLLTQKKDHAGVFVGEFIDRLGQICNVVECTTSWNEGRVIGSWVDPDGTRRNCKGGMQDSKRTNWYRHGKLPNIDYSEQPVPPEPPKPKRVDEDGSWGPLTSLAMQEIFGCPIQDGEISRQPKANRQYLPNAYEKTPENPGGSWVFRGFPLYLGGGAVIKAWQTYLKDRGYYGGSIDGYCGPQTIVATQRYLYDLGYYDGAIDGIMGPGTVTGVQRWINAQ